MVRHQEGPHRFAPVLGLRRRGPELDAPQHAQRQPPEEEVGDPRKQPLYTAPEEEHRGEPLPLRGVTSLSHAKRL